MWSHCQTHTRPSPSEAPASCDSGAPSLCAAKGVMGEYEYLAEPAKDRPRMAPNQFKPFIPASPPKKGTYGCTQVLLACPPDPNRTL
jgi:hypothetical protein